NACMRPTWRRRHRRWRTTSIKPARPRIREKKGNNLTIAAQKARANAAHEEALAHLENALSVWEGEESARVGELMAQKAAVLLSLRRPDEAAEDCRKAIALFENAGAMAQAARTSALLAGIHGWRLEYAAFHRTIDRALERLGSAEPDLRSGLGAGGRLGCPPPAISAAQPGCGRNWGRRKTLRWGLSTPIRCNMNWRLKRPPGWWRPTVPEAICGALRSQVFTPGWHYSVDARTEPPEIS